MKSARSSLIFLIVLIFYILPLKWVGSTSGIGCLMGGTFGYTTGNVWCYLWNLFRGLFLWPFQDIWAELGIQMVMIAYLLFGVGTTLILLILKTDTNRMNFRRKLGN